MSSEPSTHAHDPVSGDGLFSSGVEAARKMRGTTFFAFLLLALICNSCGGLVSGPVPSPASVSVLPGSAQPFTGATVQFNAVVQNSGSTAVTWQVNSIAGGNATFGTIDSTGFYTAPISVPSPPLVTVVAVLQADASKSGLSNVTIQPDSSIQGPLVLSPALSSVTISQPLQMQVLTPGVTNTAVNWAVDGARNGNPLSGIISASGIYTPPGAAGIHLITATLIANSGAVGSAQVAVTDFAGTLTWRNDAMRSGINNKELALSPHAVNSATFGKVFSCPLDGNALAQPLYVPNLAIPASGTRNVIFVATENDSVYAFDADENPCRQLWKASLIPPGSEAVPTPNRDLNSDDIAPFVGITGTPVISLSSSSLYVVAKSRTTDVVPVYSQKLYALDLATGQPKIMPTGALITIQGAPPTAFSPLFENQRTALLLDNGFVYIAFGSHRAIGSDQGLGDYHGWLLAYDASTLQQTAAFNVTPNGIPGGGIWQSGGGPSADSSHNVYLLSGDGPFGPGQAGTNYSNSLLRLATPGALSVTDYFSPCDEATLGLSDFGSSAPLLLPDSAGSASEPRLMLGASKSGSLYILNRDNLGGYISGCPDSSARVQTLAVGDGAILGTPLFWNNAIYVAAGNGKLKSFPFFGGTLASSPSSSQSAETLGPQGATPVVSSKAASNAIIWLIDSSGAHGTPNSPAILRAFDPINSLNEIYNSGMAATRDAAGLAVKFAIPTVANGKVYVGTQTGLDVYGLLH